jgi:hypothetical protein
MLNQSAAVRRSLVRSHQMKEIEPQLTEWCACVVSVAQQVIINPKLVTCGFIYRHVSYDLLLLRSVGLFRKFKLQQNNKDRAKDTTTFPTVSRSGESLYITNSS